MKILNTLTAFLFFLTSASYAQTLVKDIASGAGGSDPEILAVLPDKRAFFFANDGINGREPWISDGTSSGTKMLMDIHTGGSSFYDRVAAQYNGEVYFIADDGTNGIELWKTDGSSAGTKMVKNIGANSTSGLGTGQIMFQIFNGKLYFPANDGVVGNELWVTDGSTSGTQIVKNIASGTINSNPENLYVSGNRLYFRANDVTNGTEWWYTDGTLSGTKILTDFLPGNGSGTVSNQHAMTEYKGWLYFSGIKSTAEGVELCRTDGTTVEMLANINTTTNVGSYPADFIVAGGYLFFNANDGINGIELWKTDGTQSGTAIVKNISAGNGNTTMNLLGELKGKLLFAAQVSASGYELWASDGSTAGTAMIVDANGGSGLNVVHTNGEILTESLYRTIRSEYIFNGYYYYVGTDGTNGVELWRSDGTAGGTTMLNQIASGTASSDMNWLFVGGGKVWMNATNGTSGKELYVYDIPNASTQGILEKYIVQIKPNPVHHFLQFSTPCLISVLDIHGKKLLEPNIAVESLDISMLPEGTYLLLLQQNGNLFHQKFIKN
ncbi:MAG: T9SS type A sorting domain-containing protein [Bacteroidetes bacterium]|nr:T9SS type A sorting domain-containing protein [Bacteroidota bacterium]